MGWNGKNIEIEVKVDLDRVIYAEKGSTYSINYKQNLICNTCNGTREAADSAPLECYACGGTGIKQDPLFHKQ